MNTLFTGQNIIELDEVDSTNRYTDGLLQHTKLPEGTVVTSNYQTEGKGQRGRHWESNYGNNLLMSVVYYPSFLGATDISILNKAIALSIYDCLSSILIEEPVTINIKWPNDIYINNKKAVGILIENNMNNQQINHSIIGIGMNVNQMEFQQTNNATSLKIITRKDYDVRSCLYDLCSFLESRYLQLKANHTEQIDEEYNRVIYLLNEWSNFLLKGEICQAKIKHINERGLLVVEKKDGTISAYNNSEVEYVDGVT